MTFRLTPPPGEALRAVEPRPKDQRQVIYEAKRAAWRALHPNKEIKDFEEPE